MIRGYKRKLGQARCWDGHWKHWYRGSASTYDLTQLVCEWLGCTVVSMAESGSASHFAWHVCWLELRMVMVCRGFHETHAGLLQYLCL